MGSYMSHHSPMISWITSMTIKKEKFLEKNSPETGKEARNIFIFSSMLHDGYTRTPFCFLIVTTRPLANNSGQEIIFVCKIQDLQNGMLSKR